MATNGPDNPLSADPMRKQGEAMARSIREKAQQMMQNGERAASIIEAAIEDYAKQTEEVLQFFQATTDQCRALTAPPPRTPPPVDVDAMEREISAPMRRPGAPR